jgi:predicted ATPase
VNLRASVCGLNFLLFFFLVIEKIVVNDVADASILHRLFRHLYSRGTVVVSVG